MYVNGKPKDTFGVGYRFLNTVLPLRLWSICWREIRTWGLIVDSLFSLKERETRKTRHYEGCYSSICWIISKAGRLLSSKMIIPLDYSKANIIAFTKDETQVVMILAWCVNTRRSLKAIKTPLVPYT